MIAWRIYTEHKNPKLIVGLVQDFLPNASVTFFAVTGLWKGEAEDSLVIEFIGQSSDEFRWKGLARAIQLANEQETVKVTATQLIADINLS